MPPASVITVIGISARDRDDEVLLLDDETIEGQAQ